MKALLFLFALASPLPALSLASPYEDAAPETTAETLPIGTGMETQPPEPLSALRLPAEPHPNTLQRDSGLRHGSTPADVSDSPVARGQAAARHDTAEAEPAGTAFPDHY